MTSLRLGVPKIPVKFGAFHPFGILGRLLLGSSSPAWLNEFDDIDMEIIKRSSPLEGFDSHQNAFRVALVVRCDVGFGCVVMWYWAKNVSV